jgi:uncharacterized protein YqgC (DUF456 family)
MNNWLANFPWIDLLKIITLLFMGIGLLVIPILPGLIIIWAAAFGYGLVVGFTTLGWVLFAIITILMLAGSILDNVLMSAKAHKEGAPWWVVILTMLAVVAGTFIIPVPVIGGILFGLLVLFGIQWARVRDARLALTSLKGMLIGCGWAFIFRLIIGIIMIGLWIIWAAT